MPSAQNSRIRLAAPPVYKPVMQPGAGAAAAQPRPVAGTISSIRVPDYPPGAAQTRNRAAGVRTLQEIQRKVGFEIEMSVPTFGPAQPLKTEWFKDGPEGQKPDQKIQQFLFGGLDYGARIGSSDSFRLTSDHNELQEKGLAVATKLNQMGYLLGFPKGKDFKTFSNLEYVTPALEELAPNSTTAYNVQITAMTDHMKDVLGEAKTKLKKIPDPAGDYYVGIPVTELQQWLSGDYEQLRPTITDLQNSIHDQLYLQATVGVIPSALRDLYRRQLPQNMDDYNIIHMVTYLADDFANGIIDKLVQTDEFFKGLAAPATGMFSSLSSKSPEIDIEAMKGVLTTILLYIAGNAAAQTEFVKGSTQKNTVLFMAKMNLGKIQQSALPKYLRGFWGSTPPSGTIDKIVNLVLKWSPGKVDWWVSKGYAIPMIDDENEEEKKKYKPFLPNPGQFVRDVLKGDVTNHVNTAQSRQLEVDAMPEAVRNVSSDQAGVPLEYRQIGDRPNPDTLSGSLMKIVREIREVNTKHMDPLVKQALIEAADQ